MEADPIGLHEFPEYIGTPDAHIPPCGADIIPTGEKSVLRTEYGKGITNMGDVLAIYNDYRPEDGQVVSHLIYEAGPHQIWDLPTQEWTREESNL